MASTPRTPGLPAWTMLLKSVQAFATLPDWLVGVTQAQRICHGLRHSIPEFASGALVLHACHGKHLRLSDDPGWTGTYYLTLGEPASPQTSTILLRGTLTPPGRPAPEPDRTEVPFGSAGWKWYVPALRMTFQIQPPDIQLAALPELTDPQTARALLEECLQPTRTPALRLASCTPQVLRYHPGLRCTIGYTLTYPSEVATGSDWPAFVVAKTYDGDSGYYVYQNMQTLWDSPLRTNDAMRIAEPLAYLPALKLLIQGPIPTEQTLHALILSTLRTPTPESLAVLDDYLRKTAVGLAQLHSTNVRAGRAYHWDDEFEVVHTFVQGLTTAVPELTEPATVLLTCLKALATVDSADPAVPTHGTFRPAQVLLDHGHIGVIDFDSFCQAEPAMDLALFMVSLMDIGMSAVGVEEPGPTDSQRYSAYLLHMKSLADRFLGYYGALRPISRRRVAVWQALNMLNLVARSWDRIKPRRLSYTILMLEQHLQALTAH